MREDDDTQFIFLSRGGAQQLGRNFMTSTAFLIAVPPELPKK
jgi:hypothetical protein